MAKPGKREDDFIEPSAVIPASKKQEDAGVARRFELSTSGLSVSSDAVIPQVHTLHAASVIHNSAREDKPRSGAMSHLH